MEFDWQWLFLAIPLVFALGWLAARMDLRQVSREQRESPKAYIKGLNLLLNEQQDKAIDAFIEAVQHDPDTTDLHFALGNLFRRRGEYERAVRVHEHLLKRADLSRLDRERAQQALAQDFMKAGLFDRAEQAWGALVGSSFDSDARLALLTLHERSRHWQQATQEALALEKSGTGSYAQRIAHHWCERALELDHQKHSVEADEAMRQARTAAPQAARPLVLAGQRAATAGEYAHALELWTQLLSRHPDIFSLVAVKYAETARAGGESLHALGQLQRQYELSPRFDLLSALALLDPAGHRKRLAEHLQREPSLAASRALLKLRASAAPPGASSEADLNLENQALDQALAAASKPLQRYRCAACGFEAQQYFWQCPGCHGWDTFPPRRLDEL
jgi:lipopolysaccharide biosynthesis regulator YciM